MSAAVSALPKITCSNCHHTLQTHQPTESSLSPNKLSSEGETGIVMRDAFQSVQYPQLTLKASAKLAIAPFNGCVQILPAKNKSDRVTLVFLNSTSEGELRVVMCTTQLALIKDGQTHALLEEGTGESIVSQECVSNGSELPMESSSLKQLKTDSNAVPSDGDIPAKKSRKRKRTTRVDVLPRRSARVRKQSEKNRGSVELERCAARLLEEERERQKREMEQARMEQLALCACFIDFVSSVEKKDSFTSYSLPEAISRCTVETMAVTTSSAGGVVLALGTTAGEVFVVAVSVVESLLWDSLDTGTGTSTATVKSLSWLVEPADQLSLCAGFKGGSVAVWKIHLDTTNSQIEHVVVARRQDTTADITMSSWAPDDRQLAVGSQVGEVLLYYCSSDSSCTLSQTVVCGGSAITCAVWMHNSRLLLS
jgi:hypothetical protein